MQVMDRSGSSISPPPAEIRRVRSHDLDDRLGERQNQGTEQGHAAVIASSSTKFPPPQWLRIYSWNINGIAPFLQPSMTSFFTRGSAASAENAASAAPVTSLRGFLKRHHWPQIVQLQEVKISPSDEATKRAVEKAVNKLQGRSDDGPTYTVRFCLPRDKHNASAFGRKIYGVASIIRDDFLLDHVAQVREVSWDLEGRVLVVETKSKLAIFNIYAVNGTDSAYKNPDTGKPEGTRHDRKLAFHALLMEESRNYESRGFRVVLAGDINVAPARIDGYPKLREYPEEHIKNREDFQRSFLRAPREDFHGLNAVDSFRHLHPQSRKYSWISRTKDWMASCDRVDLILLSRSLVEAGALKEADICMTEADRGPSDHVPIYVSLDIQLDLLPS